MPNRMPNPGGDEFVIILETVDGEVSSRVLARIEGNFQRRNRNAPEGLSLSVSDGAAVYDPGKVRFSHISAGSPPCGPVFSPLPFMIRRNL